MTRDRYIEREQQEEQAGGDLLAWPIVDAVGSTEAIDQSWLNPAQDRRFRRACCERYYAGRDEMLSAALWIGSVVVGLLVWVMWG